MSEYGFTISVNNLASLKMKEIEESLAQMGVKAKVETKEVAEDFEFMGERMGETFKNLKGLLLTGLGITALFEGWEFIEKSKEAFEGLEKAVTRVDTVLASTKFAAGFSSQQIQNQAKELSKVIVNKRDEILDAQGMLLSFHDIKGPKFTETMKSVADFATFYKEDMTQAAMQVGKAINDPLKGMTRLQRMGVEFSAEQKEQIKNYIKQGELAKAQEIILKELRTEFGGQAQAFALTDAGKIQVAAKQWEELQFAIGEIVSRVEVSLIPSFTKVVNAIKEAFNSGVIQFFIEHIKDLVAIALKLIPIWLTYRAVMAANAAITAIFSVENGVLTASMGSLTFMTDGASVAFEGFGAAIASTGIGAMIVGIGILVEKFISMNSEISDTVSKLSNIKEITDQFKQSAESAEKINTTFSNLKNLSSSQKSALAGDIANQIKDIQDKIATSVSPQIPKTQKALQNATEIAGKSKYNFLSPFDIGNSMTYAFGKEASGLKDALKDNKSALAGYNKTLSDLLAKQAILNKAGVKTLGYTGAGAGLKGDANNISNLSGANGGLGQAKIIQIHINTLQQNNGVHESKDKADETVRMITEMVNGFSDSQNAQ